MVRKNGWNLNIICMSVWNFCKVTLELECLFLLLYSMRPRNITSTMAVQLYLAVVVSPPIVYIEIYKGDTNTWVEKKKMFITFLFVLKF